MAENPSSGIGAFTYGVARLSGRGDVSYDGSAPNSFSDVYTVVMPSPSIRPTLQNVSGVPSVGTIETSPVPGKVFRVYSIVFSQVDPTSRVWKATVKWKLAGRDDSTQPGEAEETQVRLRNVSVHWGVSEDSADVSTDLFGAEPLLNSAGDPFDSVPQKRTFSPEIRVEFESEDFPAADYALSGSINSAPFTYANVTFPKHSAMLRVECETVDDADYPYKCVYTITARVNVIAKPSSDSSAYVPKNEDIGWDIAFAQCGFNAYDEATGKKTKILIAGDDGEPREPSLPVPLDSTGHVAAYPAVRVVQIYPDADFATLSLPASYVGTTPEGDEE